MNLWLRFRALSRVRRVIVSLLVFLPLMMLGMGDVGEGLRLWGLVVTMLLPSFLIVPRLFPPVGGVDAFDPRHPDYKKAWVVDIGTVIVAAALYVAVVSILRDG